MKLADDFARAVKKMIDIRGETSVSESEAPTKFKDAANNRSPVVSGEDQVIEKKSTRQSPRLNRPITGGFSFEWTASDMRARHQI